VLIVYQMGDYQKSVNKMNNFWEKLADGVWENKNNNALLTNKWVNIPLTLALFYDVKNASDYKVKFRMKDVKNNLFVTVNEINNRGFFDLRIVNLICMEQTHKLTLKEMYLYDSMLFIDLANGKFGMLKSRGLFC